MDERMIIARCQRGDREAFREVVNGYRRMVFAVALRMLCDEDAAKDIVQETFIRVWVNIRKFDVSRDTLENVGAGSFRNWIYTIAVRLCLDFLEKESRNESLFSRQNLTEEKTEETSVALQNFIENRTPERHLENKELAEIIKSLTEKLSPKQRAVFTLVYLEGLETERVADITGLDAENIKSNLYVARKTIKEQLKRLGYE